MRGQRLLWWEADPRRCVVCPRFLRGPLNRARGVCSRCFREWESSSAGSSGKWGRLFDFGALEVMVWPPRTCNRCNARYPGRVTSCPRCGCPEFRL